MKHKTKYRGALWVMLGVYGAVLVAARIVGVPIYWVFGAAMVLISALMFMQPLFFSDFHAGARFLTQGNAEKSRMHSERFLTQLQTRPWLPRLFWLRKNFYAFNLEAQTRYNLALALLDLGDLDRARQELDRATALDPEFPLPYYGTGLVLLQSGPFAAALPSFEQAESLGLKNDLSNFASAQIRDFASTPPNREGLIEGPFVVECVKDDGAMFLFVVACLEQAFDMTGAEAGRIAIIVAHDGKAPCAAFDTEAEALAGLERFEALSRAGGHPLSGLVRPGIAAETPE